ncbi:LysR family transcriptional regulator [Bradyrhizobium jicamae]|uniref:LysR family transcriptional regulator n=1 Tax=Bradyrhizobium jicamae TaxID=280332 RepID=A0ABS5FJ95_9BRAD|nr:LysR family transcriptional regulator [Bradyrhizobium jicamae]MBR0796851.1 LysR family transcriptional regulator [Bradyrhizobium jicamae]MBR0935287.1 LysR family transcriptional regulator [Bradyrhizobium jicamae]
MDIRSLEVFYWVVRLGGFGRAAAKLNTTQPAVSARIAALEQKFGGTLLQRDRGSRPVPTALGLTLSTRAERLLNAYSEVETLANETRGMRGVIRIGVSDTFATVAPLSKFLHRLHLIYPELVPEIMTGISPQLRACLTAGEIDLALMLAPGGIIDAEEAWLCSYPMMFAASPAIALVPDDPNTLLNAPLLTYARGTQPHHDLVTALAAAGVEGALVFPNGSLATVIKLAVDGIGIAAIPRAAITRELAAGSLRELRLPITLPALDYIACWLSVGDSIAANLARFAREFTAS